MTKTLQEAELGNEYLSRASQLFSEAAHANYLDSRKGLDAARLMIDITDAASLVTGGANPYVLFFQLWTRLQHVVLNLYGQYMYVYPAKECSILMAAHTGDQAFQPEVSAAPDCDWQLGPPKEGQLAGPSVDGAAWESFKQSYGPLLDDYEKIVQSMVEQVRAGRKITRRDVEKLNPVLTELETTLSQGMRILEPPPGAAWDDLTLPIAQSFVHIEAQTAAFLLALEIPPDQANQPQVQEALAQLMEDHRAAITESQHLLANISFDGSKQGIGYLKVLVEDREAQSGSTIQVPIQLENIGAGVLEAGMAQVMLDQVILQAVEVPILQPGEEIDAAFEVTLPGELPAMLTIRYIASPNTTSEHLIIHPPAMSNQNGPRSIVLGGVLSLAGGVLLLVAVVILVRRTIGYKP